MWMKLALAVLLVLVVGFGWLGWHVSTVYRGFVASTNIGDPLYPRETLERYGEELVTALKNRDVDVAIVSRSGQPREKLPEGVMFTHSAFFLRNGDSYDVYNLYHGEENRLVSRLETDRPADFLKLLQEPDSGILIPTRDAQASLRTYIESEAYGAVHQPAYSLISNPYDARFQNCNEFYLDTLAAWAWSTTDRAEIKARLAETGVATELKASPIRRYIGPLVDERLIMDDHDGPILTTTAASLRQFLEQRDALSDAVLVEFSG